MVIIFILIYYQVINIRYLWWSTFEWIFLFNVNIFKILLNTWISSEQILDIGLGQYDRYLYIYLNVAKFLLIFLTQFNISISLYYYYKELVISNA